MSGEYAVTSASNSAHDNKARAGTTQIADGIGVALGGDRREEKASKTFRLHVKFNKRWRKESVLAVTTDVARSRHGNQRFQPG